MKLTNTLRVFLLLVILILGGCLPRNGSILTVSPSQKTQVVDIPEPTNVVAIPASVTPTVTLPTLTPIPTISAVQALGRFRDEIEGNSECSLPCWLMIVPGKNQMNEVLNNFSKFSAKAIIKVSSQSTYIRATFPTFYVTTEVYPNENNIVASILVNTSIKIKNGEVDYADPDFQKMFVRFFLPEVLGQNGPPEKILLDTTLVSAEATSTYPYALWVIYPEKGFLIRYEGINHKVGDNIKICPMQSRIEIWLWDTNTASYDDFIKGDEAGGISTGFKSIEDVTDFDNKSFYDFFLHSKLDTCFTTPVSIWPN